ncbi:MAG TPA: sensor histidine kinase [Candidatus Binataceae bacterium]|nr:sensor histidine kinase [Candidatus Binataceae bacterium]
MSSLLRVQASGADEDNASALKNSAARVSAIAAVHEQLYAGDDMKFVPLDKFLGSLCENLAEAFGCLDGIHVDAEHVAVPTDMAIPLAVIVNELVTNAIKYGDMPCRVGLRRNSQGEFTLTVSDSGQGPKDEAKMGTGSKIISAFSKHFAALIESTRDTNGYCVRLTVPMPNAEMH